MSPLSDLSPMSRAEQPQAAAIHFDAVQFAILDRNYQIATFEASRIAPPLWHEAMPPSAPPEQPKD